jgi:hypothetical protein
MTKLKLESLKVETFDTTAAAINFRGTVAAHEDATFSHCPESYGGTCIMSVCLGCNSEDTC